MRRATITALLVLLVLGVSACGTQTILESSWELPGVGSENFSKVAIIGLLKDQSECRTFELAAVDRFSAAGVQAVPGFEILEGETSLSQEEMEQRVAKSGADAVLLFKVIAVDSTNTYVPPTAYITGGPYPNWWHDRYYGYYYPYPYHYWGYWRPAVQVTASTGYWVTEKRFVIETALYRTSDNKLAWLATSNTFDPTGHYDLASSLSRVVLAKLRAAGLVKTK